MEADQKKWDTLDEYLAHFTQWIIAPHIGKKRPPDRKRIMMRGRRIEKPVEAATVTDIETKLAERRAFLDRHMERFGAPKVRPSTSPKLEE